MDLELDFDKKCSIDLSPNTVLPPLRHSSSIHKRNTRSKPPRKNEKLTLLNEEFSDITFHNRYRSLSCKNIPSRYEANVDLWRGSIYQSSKEVRRVKEINTGERSKIEISLGSGSSSSTSSTSSVSIVDSLCISEAPRNSKLISPLDGFIEIDVDYSDNNEKKDLPDRFRIDMVLGPNNSGNGLHESGMINTLHKSLSSKMDLPHSPPSSSESDQSSKINPKVRFQPIRKMFDPFMRSKSLKTPPSYVIPESSRFKTSRKSLFQDFSKTGQSSIGSSPVHLHGCLKVETKNGMPVFELSMNFPEDDYVANAWKKMDSAFNWVYTFHSMESRKKRSVSGFGFEDSNGCKNSLMSGQMQVSSHLLSKFQDGDLENYIVTEFVLYDKIHQKTATPALIDCDSSNVFLPREKEDLHPNLEAAAIVMRVPLNKRESLKYKMKPELIKASRVDRSMELLNVVIPAGTHSLPSVESVGPSSLFDRWRLGGGCDCGGWDMACPLTILGNPSFRPKENGGAFLENHKERPFELFIQGSKQNEPALALTFVKDGHYAVDFHAQLSTLQAFSICVAILHGTETGNAASEEKSKPFSHFDSLKVLIEDDVKFLIDAVDLEKKKIDDTKIVRERNPSLYVLNPPFSPISRV